MNLSFYIARRYFFSKYKKRFINIISIISILVVMVGTMALIIALSVFNGLEKVIRKLHNTFNAEIQITAAKGKSFEVSEQWLQKIRRLEGVSIISEIIEDNAVLKYKEKQMVVKLKGVSNNYQELSRMDSAIVAGDFIIRQGKVAFAVTGRGVAARMGISSQNQMDPLQFWYPRKTGKIGFNQLDPEKSFNKKNLLPSGIFSLEQTYDESYVFVPLDFMEKLLDYKDKRTSLEIKTRNYTEVRKIQAALKKALGKNFKVKNQEEQQASLIRAIKIEKLFVFFTLSFILVVASINIFFSLMMLVLDKKKDIAILQAMGADVSLIRQIFFSEGILISLTGAAAGLLLGGLLCYLQQVFGLVSMGTSTTIISSYPVEMHWLDFLSTSLTILFITLLSSYYPAKQAVKVELRENLQAF